MVSDNYVLYISKLHGLKVSPNSANNVKITFTGSPTSTEWEELRETMSSLIKKGFNEWEFNLQRFDRPNSLDLGMWVACNAAITNRDGKMQFSICENSNLKSILHYTKLDQILSINVIKNIG
ncbi:hypothetical protein LCGC14_2083890 [marine sediment metagenome]|uniref:STAS domain-containing protein n=1 Tax=marine sediment metagenome TaxID=412755 RepID=A0A0F9EF04_9ZZZZ|nr:hypothetical protein [Spirochaetota bacterium]